MKQPIYFFIFVLFFFMFSTQQISWAMERLRFDVDLPPTSRLNLENFFKSQMGSSLSEYTVAEADLNKDGLFEYVAHLTTCNSLKKSCNFLILAEKNNKIIQLSTIEAFQLMLGGTYTHGVQDFLAFQNNNNDYDYVRYIWSPAQTAYILDGKN